MALTTPQKEKVDALKAHIAEMRKTFNESTTMKAMFGSYFFDQFKKLDEEIKDIENA